MALLNPLSPKAKHYITPIRYGLLATIAGVFFILGVHTYVPDILSSQQRDQEIIPFSNQNSIEQNIFVSRSNFCCIVIPAVANITQSETIFVEGLLVDLDNSRILGSAVSEIHRSEINTEIRLEFPAQNGSSPKNYRVILTTTAVPGELTLFGAPNFRNENESSEVAKPINYWGYSKMSFEYFFSVLKNSSNWMRAFIAFIVLFWGTGFLFHYFGKFSTKPLDYLGIPISLSLAIIPPGLLLLSITKTELSIVDFLLVIALFLLMVLYFGRKNLKKLTDPFASDGADLVALLLLLIISLATRIVQADGLLVPNWVDGLAHQRIVNNLSVRGYIPLDQFYHVGFHSVILALQYFLKATPGLILMYSQWLSAVIVLPYYLVSRNISGDRWVAMYSSVFLVFWLTFPSYLAVWGRYPFLQGLCIFLALLFLIFTDRGGKFIQSLLAVGLALTHYGTFFVFILIFLAKLGIEFFVNKESRQSLSLWIIILVPALALLGYKLVALSIQGDLVALINQNSFNASTIDLPYLLTLFFKQDKGLVLGIALFGLCASFRSFSKDKLRNLAAGAAIIVSIVMVMWVIVKISIISITDFIVLLSFPISFFAGFGLKVFLNSLNYKSAIKIIMAASLLVSGAYHSVGNTNPQTVLFTNADADALIWLQNNIPDGETILVDSFLWGNEYLPADGGGWIPQLSNFEIEYLRELITPEQVLELMVTENIRYIYVGQKGGILLSILPKEKVGNIYSINGVDIFEIID